MQRRLTAITAVIVAVGLSSTAVATGGHSKRSSAPPSRLDDGKALLPRATITEQQAIAAAQGAASGAPNEVDLEYVSGRLVFNVDVGAADVKVDARDGRVVAVDHDD
jgi:uncharacterized membrane protein YkoI